jgi:ribosomal protein S18 acetylase RimI-like enzyme
MNSINYFVSNWGECITFITYITNRGYIKTKLYSNNGNTLYIDELFVEGLFRNLGIAKELINNCINNCKQKHVEFISLYCKKELIPFYNKFDFKVFEIFENGDVTMIHTIKR